MSSVPGAMLAAGKKRWVGYTSWICAFCVIYHLG